MEGGKICQWCAAELVIYEMKCTSVRLHSIVYVYSMYLRKIFEKLVQNECSCRVVIWSQLRKVWWNINIVVAFLAQIFLKIKNIFLSEKYVDLIQTWFFSTLVKLRDVVLRYLSSDLKKKCSKLKFWQGKLNWGFFHSFHLREKTHKATFLAKISV